MLIHAICDALLGAANLRDIGFHFPDTSDDFKGADSKILLTKVVELLYEKGWQVENIDSTLCLEKPKINPHIQQMTDILAPIIKVDTDAISIKATTNEKMGFIGREEGVTAYAVALLKSI